MRDFKWKFLAIALVMGITVPLVAGCSGITASASEIRSVTSNLNCPCGACTLILADCECDQAQALTKVVGKRLSKGESKEQVVQFMVQQYGQRILVE